MIRNAKGELLLSNEQRFHSGSSRPSIPGNHVLQIDDDDDDDDDDDANKQG